MNHGKIELLYQYAITYQFKKFDKLFTEMSPTFSEDEAEAWLIRAQIKLYCADKTCLEDLEKVKNISLQLQFPCLFQTWPLDNPNRFFVFSNESGSVADFLKILPQASVAFEKWYGAIGYNMVLQMQSEILYFSAQPEEALFLMQNHSDDVDRSNIDFVLKQCVMFRCNLALGNAQEASTCMMNMIQISKEDPACLSAYEAIRRWANLTTGWSGDTNRYYEENNLPLPDLEDRLEAIRTGFSQITPHEKPFVECATLFYKTPYTLQQYYMDIFNAIYWYYAKDVDLAEVHFSKAYQVALASGLLMPFVEYGAQIIPLLEHIKQKNGDQASWAEHLLELATLYEKSLNNYRS